MTAKEFIESKYIKINTYWLACTRLFYIHPKGRDVRKSLVQAYIVFSKLWQN